MLLGAYSGPPLKTLHAFYCTLLELEKCCYTERRQETLPTIVFCRGQDRPQHPQSSVLAHVQTQPSDDLLLVELVACLSVLCFQLQNTKATQSVAPWWSVSSMHWKTVFRMLKMHLNPTAYSGAAGKGNVFYCCTAAVLQCLFQVLAAYLAYIICLKLSAFITFAMVFEHLASFTSSLQYGELLLPAGSGRGTGGDGVCESWGWEMSPLGPSLPGCPKLASLAWSE